MIQFNADVSITNIITVKDLKEEVMEKYTDLQFYDKSNTLQALLKDQITNYLYNKLYKNK